MTSSTTWESVAAAKRAARDACIPREWLIVDDDSVLDVTGVPHTCGVLTPAELEITETPAPALVERILARELSSEQVVTAFCKRAAVAQQLTNCLTEILFDDAMARAREIDAQYARDGNPRGPLHGLPVSLKDNFNIKDVDTTVGFIAWCNEPQADDSEMTKIMRESGAVIHCKTNVPTAMMIAESYNNVWGYTRNPWNRKTSSGGSSGGEGALLAMKGSPIGVGTDIGGSIRIPSAFSGIFGLKPSFGRFATYGSRSGMPGQESVRSINGPMSASLDACELWARTVVASRPWERDPNMVPLPWRDDPLPEKLCFGMILDDGICRPTPPVLRALRETRAALEAAGHRVVEWTPYRPEQSKSILERFFVGDGGAKISGFIAQGGEPWPLGLATYEAAAAAAKATPPLVGDLWSVQAERTAYAKAALDHWMVSRELTGTGRPFDGVIAPVSAYSACPHHTFEHVTYTSIWNITDQAAAVFPVTRVTLDDVCAELDGHRDDVEKRIHERYHPEEVLGAPVALQVVTMRLEEEKALKLARVAAQALAMKA